MPHVIEPAPSGRAKCRGCGEKIAAGELRFGESLPNPFAEGETFHWSHLECGAMKRPESFLEAIATPRPSRLRTRSGSPLSPARASSTRAWRGSAAPSATPRAARSAGTAQKIDKGAWRIALVFFEEGRFSPAGSLHVPCAGAYFGTTDLVPRLKRFSPGAHRAPSSGRSRRSC